MWSGKILQKCRFLLLWKYHNNTILKKKTIERGSNQKNTNDNSLGYSVSSKNHPPTHSMAMVLMIFRGICAPLIVGRVMYLWSANDFMSSNVTSKLICSDYIWWRTWTHFQLRNESEADRIRKSKIHEIYLWAEKECMSLHPDRVENLAFIYNKWQFVAKLDRICC